MKNLLPVFALMFGLAACQNQATATAILPPPLVVTVPAEPTVESPTATTAPATSIPSPTPENPPIALPSVFQFTPPSGGTVIYDFASHLC